MTEPKPTGRKSGRVLVAAFSLSAFVILVFAFAPLISAMLAGMIANAHGCALDEGSVHPCLIGGTDYGETLSFMFVLGWFGLVTMPIGALAGIVWAVVLVVILLVNFRGKKS